MEKGIKMYFAHVPVPQRNINVIHYTQALIKNSPKIYNNNNNKKVTGIADCPLCLALAALLQTAHQPRVL